MSFRLDAQNLVKDSQKLEKYFRIASNVYPGEWEINFSKDLNYNELLFAFSFCIARALEGLNEDEKKECLARFFGLFPKDDISAEKQREILSRPNVLIENKDEDFCLFVVNFEERSCWLKSNCPRIVIIQILYWAFQVISSNFENNSLLDLMKRLETLGLLRK